MAKILSLSEIRHLLDKLFDQPGSWLDSNITYQEYLTDIALVVSYYTGTDLGCVSPPDDLSPEWMFSFKGDETTPKGDNLLDLYDPEGDYG